MHHETLAAQPAATDEVDLQTILEAWGTATQRLQETHELLRAEVKRLTDELESKNRELAHKNRLADLGQMASHVAHEVRNGLVPMKLYLNLLRRKVAGEAACVTIADKISTGFTALECVVNDLLHFTAHRDPNRQQFAVHEVVFDLTESLAPTLAAQQIKLNLQVNEGITLEADREMIRRALLNLVLNAIDVMPRGGELYIAAAVVDSELMLTVTDSGPGLADEVAGRMFEPFYSTKSTGTGLGLAIVYRIAEVHQGQISAANRATGGAVFTLRIPHAHNAHSATRMVA